jgi:hypothetical protein
MICLQNENKFRMLDLKEFLGMRGGGEKTLPAYHDLII